MDEAQVQRELAALQKETDKIKDEIVLGTSSHVRTMHLIELFERKATL